MPKVHRDIADPIFPDHGILQRRAAVRELYRDPIETIVEAAWAGGALQSILRSPNGNR